MHKNGKLLTMEEVAAALQVTKRSVHTYLKANAFPNAFKTSPAPNARWRVPKSDLDAYIARMKKKSAAR